MDSMVANMLLISWPVQVDVLTRQGCMYIFMAPYLPHVQAKSPIPHPFMEAAVDERLVYRSVN